MAERYTKGFKDPDTTCFWADDNEGFVPIVDSDVVCVALVDGHELAAKIVALLNAEEAKHVQVD